MLFRSIQETLTKYLTSAGLNGVEVIDNTFRILSVSPFQSAGAYRLNSTLDFRVTFNRAVTVSGSRIRINLTSGSVFADYLSGTGTAEVTYRYTVGAGQNDSDGIKLVSPLELNGGTIIDANAKVPALSYGVPNLRAYLVDTSVPTIASITPPSNGTFLRDQVIDFSVKWSEVISLQGTPRIPVTIGSNTRYAYYYSGSGTTTSVFRYTVSAADSDLNGITSTSSIDLNGGSITDVAGNGAALTFSAPVLTNVNVVGTQTVISHINAYATLSYYEVTGPDLPVDVLANVPRDFTIQLQYYGPNDVGPLTISSSLVLPAGFTYKTTGTFPGAGGTCGAAPLTRGGGCLIVLTVSRAAAGNFGGDAGDLFYRTVDYTSAGKIDLVLNGRVITSAPPTPTGVSVSYYSDYGGGADAGLDYTRSADAQYGADRWTETYITEGFTGTPVLQNVYGPDTSSEIYAYPGGSVYGLSLRDCNIFGCSARTNNIRTPLVSFDVNYIGSPAQWNEGFWQAYDQLFATVRPKLISTDSSLLISLVSDSSAGLIGNLYKFNGNTSAPAWMTWGSFFNVFYSPYNFRYWNSSFVSIGDTCYGNTSFKFDYAEMMLIQSKNCSVHSGNTSTVLTPSPMSDFAVTPYIEANLQSYGTDLFYSFSNAGKIRIRRFRSASGATDILDPGAASTGINFDTAKFGASPSVAVLNDKVYAVWAESVDNTETETRIRAKVYNGTTWTSVDKALGLPLNFDPAKRATDPQFIVYGGALYAGWIEVGVPSTRKTIRIARYNGNDTAPDWTHMDWQATGIDIEPTGLVMSDLKLLVHRGVLFATYTDEAADTSIQSYLVAYTDPSVTAPGVSDGWTFVMPNGDPNLFGISEEIKGEAITHGGKMYIYNSSSPALMELR